MCGTGGAGGGGGGGGVTGSTRPYPPGVVPHVGGIGYIQGYSGPKYEYSPQGQVRKVRTKKSVGAPSDPLEKRIGPTSRYANRPYEVAIASGTEPVPIAQLTPALVGASSLQKTSLLG